MTNLERHVTGIEEFAYDCPVGDCVYSLSGSDFSGHVEPAYAAGYAVLLPPPGPGAHELHFSAVVDGGTVEDASDDFVVDVRYHLTIE